MSRFISPHHPTTNKFNPLVNQEFLPFHQIQGCLRKRILNNYEGTHDAGIEDMLQKSRWEERSPIFIEIPKPKAKKTVNVEIQDLNSPRPNSNQSKLPYPERMKVRENDKPSAQHSRFLKMFKQLRLEIGLKDALIEMPKFNKWLSSLLRNKEKLEEIAITTSE
ncbi:hypothetical protein Tco_0213722 [Tanacetum coccineum]